MKKIFCVLFSALLLAQAARAQDAAVEERLRRLEKSLENIQAENFKLRQDITDLGGRLEKVIEVAKSTSARAGNNEDIAKLAAELKELDQRRIADHKNLIAEVERMLKSLPPPPAASSGTSKSRPPRNDGKSAPPPPDADAAPAVSDKGVWHTVEKGQTLGEVIKAFNEDLKSKGKSGRVTLKAVKEANPKMNPDRLIVGNRIFIPIPEK